MRCQVCNETFNSFKWYELDNHLNSKLIMCDKCLLSLYKSKKRVLEGDIAELNNKIKELEDSLI